MPIAWDEFQAVDEPQTETDWTQFEAAPEKQTIQQATAPLTPEQQLAITPDQDRFQLVTGRAPESGQSFAELAGGPVIPIPELHGKTLPGKIGAAIFNVGKQIPEALETPATWALGPFGVTPVGQAILGGVFGGLAAKRAGEQAGEASVTGDPQTAIESGLNFGLGAFMAKPGFSKVELPPSLQGPPAPGALLRLPEGGTPPRIEPLPPEPLAPAAAPVPAPKPPATPPAAAAEPLPATAGERFKTASEADLNRGNNFSTEIGMQVESLDDLKALAKERADALARQSALLKELGQFKDRNSPEYAAKWKEVSLAGLKSQLAGEAIQVATNSGGWVEGSTDANFGERPLDWSKNPEVADWLSKNSEALNIKLPEAKPAAEPAPAPAAAPAPEPAAAPVKESAVKPEVVKPNPINREPQQPPNINQPAPPSVATPNARAAIDRLLSDAIGRFAREGRRGSEWAWDHATQAEKDAVDKWLVATKHPSAQQPGTAEGRFHDLVQELAPKPAAVPISPPVAAPVAKAAAEVQKVAATEGQRSAKEVKQDLIDGLQEKLMKAPPPADAKPGETVTVDIPGDGVFTIPNDNVAIQTVLDRARKIKTDPGKPEKISKAAIKSSERALAKSAGENARLAEQAKADAEAAAAAKPPPGPISAGPGAASPGDVPPEPPIAAPVSSRPPEQRPNGIVTPSSPGLASMIGALPGKVMTYLRGAAGDTMSKTTASNQPAGEAGAEYISSHIYAPRGARVFSTEVLRGTDIDPARFGAALAEDNLRSIREGFRAEATAARARGNADAADAATAKADAVTTLVGHKNSPFATEDEYQDFLADPVTKEAVERHKQQWEEVVDPMFKKAQSIDPNEELAPRGQQTGARVNLKAILPGETGTRVVRSGPSLTATFKRKSPFARKAKGTGTAYEVDYHELMSNTFTRQTEIANKNAFDKALVAAGDAVIGRPGQQVEIKGERGVPFPLTRRLLIGQGEPIPLAQNIYVRQSLAREYRTASNVDPGYRIPVVTPVMNVFNRAALAGLTDFTIHASNQMTALFNRPISGRLLSDTLLSTFGRADVPVTLTRALIKSFQDNEAQLTELAKIGALRETHKGGNPLGKILAKTDQVTRLLLDDTYQRLVKAGIAEDTATARREYANGIGQYNKRAQGMFIRILRDTGFGPFATAGRTFNAMGIKMATLSPGVKATNNFAAAALRLNVLSKWVGFATLLGTLNYLLTKDKKGGLMGRPGVPFGNLDTGRNDKNGKPLSIPLSDIMGLGRAARVTGIKGAVNAKRLGLTDTDALDTAARDIINATIGPAMGPAPRAGFVSATGRPPAVNVPRTAPVAPPGTSQFKVNVEEALKDANPVVKSFADWHAGKTAGEAFGQQLPRFTMQAGKTEAVTAKYPKIVNKAQLNEYAEYLAGEARKIPLRERYRWVQDRLRADEVTGANANETRVLLRRRGVFHYQ